MKIVQFPKREPMRLPPRYTEPDKPEVMLGAAIIAVSAVIAIGVIVWAAVWWAR